MVTFTAVIFKFGDQGEKTGWTYIDIPADVAQQIKPDNRRSFRVRGTLDNFAIAGIAVMPMGQGNFILTLNAALRKGVRKGEGAMIKVSLEEDTDFKLVVPDDLLDCLADDPDALQFFESLLESHRRYFVNWLNSAKTVETRAKRIAMICHAMANRMDYGQMIRHARDNK
ncbi:YdeI/OmpD-associated family protein [Mucilaginibacter daejeonensis]|uniref:YdeI/OmpD-associated family protein n=1 Tax=Mucilaginibacter daejeonensis TaxID=398049 RepID=UPI001D172D38|nr:YdeI/OmpD-associated family protein [Mucilaginibacter daejeonensis]UEG54412.1 YdeI/OmpD-associated family protein [Mucilaginibacter daejeonensis]